MILRLLVLTHYQCVTDGWADTLPTPSIAERDNKMSNEPWKGRRLPPSGPTATERFLTRSFWRQCAEVYIRSVQTTFGNVIHLVYC